MKFFLLFFMCIAFSQNVGAFDFSRSKDLPGHWVEDSIDFNGKPSAYSLYLPSSGKPIGLMVMLHGCFQQARDFADDTGMNEVGEKYGFAVLYPEQSYQDNVWKCWNWFKPENQKRDSGELLRIVKIVKHSMITHGISDSKKVFVGGLSSGGAMAVNLAVCHSDLFRGVAIHSGLEYRAATTEAEAHRVMKYGPTQDVIESGRVAAACAQGAASPLAAVVVNGADDPYVNPLNSVRIIQQLTKFNDILDDGADNYSQSSDPVAVRDSMENGYPFRTELFGGNDGAIRLFKLTVKGLGHKWGGAARSGQYADPKGPNVSEHMWLFLSQYARE